MVEGRAAGRTTQMAVTVGYSIRIMTGVPILCRKVNLIFHDS